MTIVLHNMPMVIIAGLIAALGGLVLTRAERERPRGGGAYPAMPLGLLMSNMISWIALILIGVASVFLFGVLYPVVAAGLVAAALIGARNVGADLSRYYALRLPLALASLAAAVALWLTALMLIAGAAHV